MKRIFYILFLFAATSSFGQSKIEILSSLDHSSRILANEGLVQRVRSTEKGKLNYHFGANYFQQMKEKFWLKIGMGFTSMGYQSELIELRYGGQHNGQGGFNPSGGSGESLQTKYNFHFLEIPIAAHFEFSQKKIRPFAEAGIATMYYLQSKNKNILNGVATSESFREKDIKPIQIAAIFSFGFTYSLTEKLEALIQPNFRYHFTKLTGGPVKEYEWGAGLALGARFFLK